MSSFEHVRGSQRNVRTGSRVTHADKMHAKNDYDSVRLEGGTMTAARLTTIGITLASVTVFAQTPKQPDWKALEDETMRHYQAVLRLDTRNPPGNEHLVAEYLKQVFDKEGIPGADLRLRSEAPEPRRAAEGQRQEAAAADHGPQRRRHRRRSEVEVPAVQRDARRRLRLRPRHGRRQGQPDGRADDDAAAEAAERAARSRRDLPLRSGRRRQLGHRHRLHGEGALPGDRRRVLPRRGRRRDADRRRR